MTNRSNPARLRPEVAWFAQQMELKLRENDHKGGWSSCNASILQLRMREESLELERAVINAGIPAGGQDEPHRVAIVREAADVANFAMMIADNWRGCGIDTAVEALGEPEAQPVSPIKPHPHNEPGEPPAVAYALWDPCEREFCEVYEDRKTACALAVNGLGVVEYWRAQTAAQPQLRDESWDVWLPAYVLDDALKHKDARTGRILPESNTSYSRLGFMRYIPHPGYNLAIRKPLAQPQPQPRDESSCGQCGRKCSGGRCSVCDRRWVTLCGGSLPEKAPQIQPRDESRDVWVKDDDATHVDMTGCVGWERYAPYSQLEEALEKVEKYEPVVHQYHVELLNRSRDSELLDAILKAFGGIDSLMMAIKNAIAERAKR